MTQDQENEFEALSNFIKKDFYLRDTATSMFKGLGIANAGELFVKFFHLGYFDTKEDETIGTPENPSWGPAHHDSARMYSISSAGLKYLQYLMNIKQHEILEKQQIQSVISTNNSVKTTNGNVILTNRIAWINAGATLLIGIIVLSIQIKTCRKDEIKYNQEVDKTKIEAIEKLEQQKLDTQFQNKVVRILEAMKDSLKR